MYGQVVRNHSTWSHHPDLASMQIEIWKAKCSALLKRWQSFPLSCWWFCKYGLLVMPKRRMYLQTLDIMLNFWKHLGWICSKLSCYRSNTTIEVDAGEKHDKRCPVHDDSGPENLNFNRISNFSIVYNRPKSTLDRGDRCCTKSSVDK